MRGSVWKKEIISHQNLFSWNQLFSNFFSKNVTFTKFLSKSSHRGNYGNSLSYFFDKSFVKVTFVQKKMLKSLFDEFLFGWHRLFIFTHCEATSCSEPHSVIFLPSFCLLPQKFHEINFLIEELCKLKLIWRNKLAWQCIFHFSTRSKIFREINLISSIFLVNT